MIPFNKPFVAGRELLYIQEAVASGKLSGDGMFTKRCERYCEERYGFAKCLLTTSCTDALEMAALLSNIGPGDEVIVPAYTFVSTANAFALRGAEIVFADSGSGNPNLDPDILPNLITPRTRVIVVVHYAGVACDMEPILALAKRHSLILVEDAAQAIDSYYVPMKRSLGGLGTFAAFSFHETKNIIAGEGGMLVVNDPALIERAEIIREKGTNRSKFFRGEIDKYNWVDVGSSFLPSELVAAFLWGQLEQLDHIQAKRLRIWERYDRSFRTELFGAEVSGPQIPCYASNNGHMYYFVVNDARTRTELLRFLKSRQILAVFHYQALHRSPYYSRQHAAPSLVHAESYTDRLVRLPFFYGLTDDEQDYVIKSVLEFFGSKRPAGRETRSSA